MTKKTDKLMPRVCPQCKGHDIHVQFHEPVYPYEANKGAIYCLDCGHIGIADFRLVLIKGTATIFTPEK